MGFKCGKCGVESTPENRFISRCDDCNKCDICGTKEDLCHYSRGVFCDTCHVYHAKEKVEEFQGKEIDTDYTDEITCPYCGYEFSDSWEMGDEGEYDCCECSSKFVYSRDVSVSYSSSKIE